MINFKKSILFAFLIFILVFSLNTVCAETNQTSLDNLSVDSNFELNKTNDDLINSDVGTFTDLSNEISNGNSSIKLTKDYKISEGESHVVISKSNLVIDGQGHTLDANKQTNIFSVTGSNITFKNITFINGLGVNGGAIGEFYGYNKFYTIRDCTFINNTATNCGGAVYAQYSPIYVYNSKFINNRNNGNYGGGAIFSDRNIYVDGCEFYGNTIAKSSGSAIRSSRGLISLSNSIFPVVQEGKNHIQASSYDLSNNYLSFAELNKLIANSNGAVNLDYDYKYLPDFDSNGITISKTVTVNGNGHTIDAGSYKNSIFKVTANDVVLKNMNIVNGYVYQINNNGVAISWSGANGLLDNVTIKDCIFNSTLNAGNYNWWNSGIVYWNGANGKINNVNFISNTIYSSKGIIIWQGQNGVINNSYFSDCSNLRNYYVGVLEAKSFFIYWNADNGKFLNSVVKNLKLNVRDVSVPCYVLFEKPGFVDNVSFINCQHTNQGQTVSDLYMPFSPIEDYIKDFTGTLVKLTPTVNVSDSVIGYNSLNVSVNSVRSGSVTYRIDGGSSQTVNVNNNGQIAIDVSALSEGQHTITYSYNGNSYYNNVGSQTSVFTYVKFFCDLNFTEISSSNGKYKYKFVCNLKKGNDLHDADSPVSFNIMSYDGNSVNIDGRTNNVVTWEGSNPLVNLSAVVEGYVIVPKYYPLSSLLLIINGVKDNSITLSHNYTWVRGIDTCNAGSYFFTLTDKTIDGNGYFIDGLSKLTVNNEYQPSVVDSHEWKLFNLGNNAVLKNINLKNYVYNRYGYVDGGAIYVSGANAKLINVNVTNVGNSQYAYRSLNVYGGAIIWNGNDGLIEGCNFINCHGGQFGTITILKDNVVMNNCIIEGATVYNWLTGYLGAAAIRWNGDKGTLINTIVKNSNRNSLAPDTNYQATVSFTKKPVLIENLTVSGSKYVYDLQVPFLPVDDYLGSNVELGKGFYRLTPSMMLHEGVFSVNVKSGSVSYKIDGSSPKTANVDSNGHFVLNFDSSKNHYIEITYNQNDYYSSSTAYFNYDSASGNSLWYVDGNYDHEGTGLSNNPFKTLKHAINTINVGDVICIAPGTYTGSDNLNLTFSKLIQISRWGNSGEVIFDAKGTSKIFTFNTAVNLTSLIFKNAVSDFGGAITFNNVSNIINCIFINNTARYGGAICVGENVNAIFTDCEFNSDVSSLGGGAVYSWGGNPIFINSKFFNCLSQYGGAIFSLEGDLILNNTNFNNNSALGFGGAVYKRSNQLTIDGGIFEANSAYYDGGAVYSSHASSNIKGFFDKNIACYGGGAVHSLAGTLTSTDIVLNGDVSPSFNDIVDTMYINPFIDFANYTLIVANTSNFNGTIPSYFSLPENGWDTSVKNQGSLGICWDYSTITMVETAVKKATGMELDLSENNLKNLLSKYSDWGWNREPNAGGGRYDGCSYLANSLGPILECIDPTGAYGFSPLFDNTVHVSNIPILVRSRNAPLDNDEVKKAIMQYGSIKASMSTSGANGYNYYQNTTTGTGHAVSIVGWDDNYSKNNFKNNCPGDGAWIVKNSWGPNSGKNGYIYISYYDTSFAWGNLFYILFNDTIRYDRVYQYDYGNYATKSSGGSVAYYKNIYTSVKNEGLTGFSTHFADKSNWEVKVYVEGQLKQVQNGTSMSAGYFTFNFNKIIPVAKGQQFTIEIKVNNKNFPYVNKNINTLFCGAGVSYYSKDGKTWNDLDKNNQVASLKVFTQNMPGSQVTINPITNVTYSSDVIVNFNVLNRTHVNYILSKDGKTIVQASDISGNSIRFSSLATGMYTISIINENSDYYVGNSKSANFTVFKASSSVNIKPISSVKYGSKVNINFDITNLTLATYVVKSIEGDVVISNTTITNLNKITLSTLNAGQYVISIYNVENENYTGNMAHSTFTILKLTPSITITASSAIYPNVAVNVKSDVSGDYIIKISNQSKKITLKANKQSTIIFTNLNAGEYVVYADYDETANYNHVSKNINVKVLKASSSVILNNINSVIYPNTPNISYETINRTNIIVKVKNMKTGIEITIPNSNITSSNIVMGTLDAGNYMISINNTGNNNYDGSFASSQFTVNKYTPVIKISVENTVYPNDVIVDVVSDVSGIYTVNVGDKTQSVSINADKSERIIFNNLNANEKGYKINVSCNETVNYNSYFKDAGVVKVFKASSSVKISEVVDGIYNTKIATFNIDFENKTNLTYIILKNNKEISSGDYNALNSSLFYLDVGQYEIVITNNGDVNYNSSSDSVLFNVLKADSKITISPIVNVTYNSPVTVNFNVKNKTSVTYIVKKNDEVVVKNTTVNDNSIYLSNLTSGKYIIIIANDLNGLYNGNVQSAEFTIEKAINNIEVSVDNKVLPENVTVNIEADVDGIYTVNIGQYVMNVNVKMGKGSNTIKLPAGINYITETSFEDTQNYNLSITEAEFNVSKCLNNIKIEILSVNYPDNVTVSLISDIGGEYTVDINGFRFDMNSNSSKSINLTPGNYFANISGYLSDDYQINVTPVIFKVDMGVNIVKVSVNDINYGQNAYVNVTATVKGNYTLDINGTEIIVEVSDKGYGVKALDNIIKVGRYYANVTSKLPYYVNSITNTTFNVLKANANLSINVVDVIYPNNVLITVKSEVNGKYTVNINGSYHIINVVNGSGYLSVKKDAGNYKAIVSLNSTNYIQSLAYCEFKVFKNNNYNYISSNDYIINYGQSLTLNTSIDTNATGKVRFYDITNDKLLGQISINDNFTICLDAGIYKINASYDGDNNHEAMWRIISINVKKIVDNDAVNITLYKTDYKSDIIIKSKVNKYAVINGTVSYYINGKYIGFSPINGDAVLENNLNAGRYNVTAVYLLDNYEFGNKTFELIINPTISALNSTDALINYASQPFILNITSKNALKIAYQIYDEGNNLVKNTTVNADESILLPKLSVGRYSIILSTLTDSNHMSVTKQYEIIVGDANIILCNNTSAHKAQIKINITVPGEYNIKIADVYDKNITLMQGINVIDDIGILNAGEYEIAIFSTSNNQNKINFLQRFNITSEKLKSYQILSTKNIATYYLQNNLYSVKVTDENLNPNSGVLVTFNVGGKNYNVISDKNGFASLKLNLKPGNYRILTKINNYHVQNSLTVKHIIKAKKVSKIKKSKINTIKIIVKGHNTILKKSVKFVYAGKSKVKVKFTKDMKKQIVQFKFKGKIYNVKVNRKAKGVVKLNKKLKKGKKYKAKVTYIGPKLYKKAKLKIKLNDKKYKVKTNKKAIAKFKITKKMLKKIKSKKVKYTINYKQDSIIRFLKIK